MKHLEEGDYGRVRSRVAAWCGFAAACTLALGCSRGFQQDTAKVQGTVKLDGKLLPGGSVMFTPATGRGAVGTIDARGNFVLGTYETTDGAIVGRHRVAVFPVVGKAESDELPPNYIPIPPRYQNGYSSGIEVEVKAGEDNVVVIQLASAP
jgi:hypothetical protein